MFWKIKGGCQNVNAARKTPRNVFLLSHADEELNIFALGFFWQKYVCIECSLKEELKRKREKDCDSDNPFCRFSVKVTKYIIQCIIPLFIFIDRIA